MKIFGFEYELEISTRPEDTTSAAWKTGTRRKSILKAVLDDAVHPLRYQ